MNLMIDDLDMPNESMTISSLSQSPWQGRSQNSYLSNIPSNRMLQKEENSAIQVVDHTQGTEELDSGRSPFSGSLEEGTSTGPVSQHIASAQNFLSAKDKLRQFNTNN